MIIRSSCILSKMSYIAWYSSFRTICCNALAFSSDGFPIKFFGYVDNAGLSSFNAGKEIQPLMHAFGQPIANFMCYETAYPEQIREQLQGAGFISIISDDSWFGDSIAKDQQLQIAQVRAIESGKYILHTTTDGVTAIIEPNGSIKNIIAKNKRKNLTDYINKTTSNTIWKKFGMDLLYILISLCILISFYIDIFYNRKSARRSSNLKIIVYLFLFIATFVI